MDRMRATLLALLALAPQDAGRPAEPPLPPVKESRAPGLALSFSPGDSRITRLAALSVPAGTAPSPFAPPGAVRATLEGYVSVDLGTEVLFSAELTGRLVLEINGKQVLERSGGDVDPPGKSVLLKKGRNRLVARYEGPAEGDARLRLFWTSEEFQHEPVHPLALSHDAQGSAVRGGARLRSGRDLVAQRRCLKCHAHPGAGGMPELGMDAPSLETAGARLNPAWMAAWIRDPRSLRPEATMPGLRVSEIEAADLVAWLGTLGKPAPDPAPDAGAAKAGGHLFATMRCVGCHTLPDKEPQPDRVPLRHVRAKWRPAALAAFLKKPDAHYAWIEMPVFGLTDAEAVQLAAFLVSASRDLESAPVRAGDPATGKVRFETLGCAACHQAPAKNLVQGPALAAIPAAGWSRGCLAEKPAKAPDFGFAAEAREALVAFASTDLSALSRDAAPEFFERQFRALRCTACHVRDDVQDAWSDLQDEAKALLPPKKPDDGEFQEIEVAVPHTPPLTWTGERLKPEWTAAFFAGKVAERPRPYLGAIRMPSFPARAPGLSLGLALSHGIAPASPPDPAPDRALSEIGRKLSGPGGGLDCLSCHAIGGRRATKVFEAPAPNFRLSRDRIRRDWFERWVREPLRVEPGTKMPQFFQQGRSQLVEVLDGDAGRQIEALWQYLLEGEAIRPPGE
jgi:cytochrome c1